jgi:hypothetical protein
MGEQKPSAPNRQQGESRQPGLRSPGDQIAPGERASAPERNGIAEHHEAARRQARQDPLQTRDR